MRRSAEAAQRVHWRVDERLGFGGWWIDPGCFRFGRRCRGPIDEALRVLAKGLIESVLASEVDGVGLAVMNLVWGHQADPEVVMVLIVPIKIIAQEASGILDAAEARGELRLVFQVLELAFGERVVARTVRAAMRAGE